MGDGMIRRILIASILIGLFAPAHAVLDDLSGTTSFPATAKQDSMTTPDGRGVTICGFANADAPDDHVQYPGPTQIVNVDLLPGEMITMLTFEPPGVSILMGREEDLL